MKSGKPIEPITSVVLGKPVRSSISVKSGKPSKLTLLDLDKLYKEIDWESICVSQVASN